MYRNEEKNCCKETWWESGKENFILLRSDEYTPCIRWSNEIDNSSRQHVDEEKQMRKRPIICSVEQ
jgi:hypothetical protein